jgi:LSD1 subclass zinc finger protein
MAARSSRGRSAATGTREALQVRVDSLHRKFNKLEDKAQFTTVHESIARIEERLSEYPMEVKALERRGYLHSGPLNERIHILGGQWRKVSSSLRSSLRSQQNRLSSEVRSTSRKVNQANSSRQSSISSAESAVNSLESKIGTAERNLSSNYENVDSELQAIGSDFRRLDWMLDQLEESNEIKLKSGEGPLIAVKTEWHRDGKEGPEGVLFLTDQRLLFEQREEIVTKKRFGIFKSESEMVQKLWLDINVYDIASVEDSEEGGFLGIGKDDILEITCSGDAPISRGRFHLDGQDSAGWRTQIKTVQSGDIAKARHKTAQIEDVSHAIPSQCPNCLAPLPDVPRGATRIKCEFCGTLVGPEIPE